MPAPRDEAVFRQVYARYYDEMWRYATRRLPPADAAALLSDIFVVVWRRLGEAPSEPSTVAWLYTIAHHCLANRRRAERRQGRLRSRLSILPSATAVEDDVDNGLGAALSRLGEEDQELLRLLYWEELSHGEVAVVFGISVNAVAIRSHRARIRLRRMLDRKAEQAGGHEGLMQEMDER